MLRHCLLKDTLLYKTDMLLSQSYSPNALWFSQRYSILVIKDSILNVHVQRSSRLSPDKYRAAELFIYFVYLFILKFIEIDHSKSSDLCI